MSEAWFVAFGFFASGFGFGWVARGQFVLWKYNRALDAAEARMRPTPIYPPDRL